MAADRGWRRPLGVRWQATIVAVVTVGLTLLVGAIGFVVLTERRLVSAIETAASARADAIVTLVEAGALAEPLPSRDPELLGQVIARDGTVVAADQAALRLPPIDTVSVVVGERRVLRVDSLANEIRPEIDIEDDGPFVVVAEGVTLPAGSGTVLVAASLEDAATARQAFVPLLGIGLPLVLGIVGLVTWLLTGRSLRPVDAMRTEAQRISALALDHRLPVPGTRDELQRLAITLNDMLERLEQSATRQRQFVGDASHEMKSPITTLRTMVDVAERDPAVLDVAEFMSDLDEEVARMERLVLDLLTLARADEGAHTADPAAFDLSVTAAAVATAASNPGGIVIDTGGLVPVHALGRRTHLEQAIRNVVDNAIRHATATVWLETWPAGANGVVAVSDDGPGIGEADTERIFERFVRLDESRTRETGGTGLGLAVARAAVRAMGGELRLGPTLHGGATFEISLPLTTDA